MEQMLEYLNFTITSLQERVWGESFHWVIFVAYILFLLFFRRRKKGNGHMLWYPLLALGVLICPFWAWFIEKVPGYGEYYMRLYTFLPWILFVGFAVSLFVTSWKKPVVRMLMCGLMTVVLVFSGCFVYATPQKGTVGYAGEEPEARLVQRENWWKIPSDAANAAYIILQDSPEGAKVLAQYKIGAYLRQYSSKIVMPLSAAQTYRSSWGGWKQYLKTSSPDVEFITSFAKETETHYLVFRNKKEEVRIAFEEAGWEIIGDTGNYLVYKLEY